ncbi:hypothetical protein GCM10010521_24880 [Streptomyces rameus]|uniref:Uncharacterized protein n=1 Tax=Streptomyces rameus TaxID=68261 RepID=A0ABP6N8J4_9ACTN
MWSHANQLPLGAIALRAEPVRPDTLGQVRAADSGLHRSATARTAPSSSVVALYDNFRTKEEITASLFEEVTQPVRDLIE